jgi:DNA (cytosine-5)-methyltransferase 1
MNHLDLFSGIGGFSLALEKVGFKTVGFCEIDPYCRLLLQKHWKGVTIHNDIKKLEAKDIKEPIDILTGGFPCQPYSVAGKQKGTGDNRYLWPDMFRVIKEVKPSWIIAENVRGIINIQDGMVFETVCSDLEAEGFEIQTFIIPAAGVGAPHKRERVWIVGYSKHNGSSNNKIMENSRRTLRQGAKFSKENANESKQENANKFERSSSTSKHHVANSNSNREKWDQPKHRQGSRFEQDSTDVANTTSEGLEGQFRSKLQGTRKRFTNGSEKQTWWQFEPDVGRVANGVPGRVYRLKGLGNSIVPQIAEEIGKAIWKTLNQN